MVAIDEIEPDRGRGRAGSPRLWAFVAVTLVALLGGGAATVRALEAGPRPPDGALGAGAAKKGPAPRAPEAGAALDLAGSGSNVPLVRVLAKAFGERAPGVRVVVHESIGSTGGVRAARDGQVELGLVSRPLTADEAKLGLVVVPHARVAVVVAAHPGVREDDLGAADLVTLYRGERSRFRDGAPVVVLQRERGDSSHLVVGREVPGFAAANDDALRAGRWRVLYHDRAMQEALMATDGAIGLFDLGQIVSQNLPLRVLAVDGVAPTPENVRAGRYRFVKDLAFVSAGAPSGAAAAFLEFVRSPEGREATRRAGYLPLPDDAEAPR
jgi:phosphate transport system substrate-binding protein